MPKKRKKKFSPTKGVRPRVDATAAGRVQVYKQAFERLLNFVRTDGNENRTDLIAVQNALVNTYVRLCVELGTPVEEVQAGIAPCYEHHSEALDADGPLLAFREPTKH